jgi:hypothetical protein
MSLHPQDIPPVPEGTKRVARAAFPRGNVCMRRRDESGTIYDDRLFAALFPARGQPAASPWRLALKTVMQFQIFHSGTGPSRASPELPLGLASGPALGAVLPGQLDLPRLVACRCECAIGIRVLFTPVRTAADRIGSSSRRRCVYVGSDTWGASSCRCAAWLHVKLNSTLFGRVHSAPAYRKLGLCHSR